MLWLWWLCSHRKVATMERWTNLVVTLICTTFCVQIQVPPQPAASRSLPPSIHITQDREKTRIQHLSPSACPRVNRRRGHFFSIRVGIWVAPASSLISNSRAVVSSTQRQNIASFKSTWQTIFSSRAPVFFSVKSSQTGRLQQFRRFLESRPQCYRCCS